jgi:hypothetical protein
MALRRVKVKAKNVKVIRVDIWVVVKLSAGVECCDGFWVSKEGSFLW